MYYVKVQGESIADLKEGLERHLRELSGVTKAKSVSVTTSVAPVAESDEEEMEEVASPFANHAPSLEVAPTLNTVVDNEVDAEGIPWDSRIHASSKAKVKNGTWRTQRNVDENLVYQVKNELRARVAAPVVQAPVVAAPVVQAPVVAAPVVQAPVVAAPLPTMQQSGHTLETFKAQFPMVIASLITEKKIDQAYVNSLKQYFNVAEIWQVNDEQKAMMFDQFVQYGFVQRVV